MVMGRGENDTSTAGGEVRAGEGLCWGEAGAHPEQGCRD